MEKEGACVCLYGDHQVALKLSKDEFLSDQTQHIQFRYHLGKHHVKIGFVSLEYISTRDMIEDLFITGLWNEKHTGHLKIIGLYS